jgi:hypothetical protein
MCFKKSIALSINLYIRRITMNVSRRALLGAAAIATTSIAIPQRGYAVTDPDLTNYVSTGKMPKPRYWAEGTVLNQHGADTCEAFALVGAWMSATGVDLSLREGNDLARHIYNKAVALGGSAPINVQRVARDLGMVKSWAWIQSVDDIVDAVCQHGSVTMGVRANKLFENTNGREVKGPGSGKWEGHAVVATAYLPFDKRSGRGPSLRLRNSWGKWWGQDGSAWMTVADLKKNLGPMPYPGYYQDAALSVFAIPSN